MNSGLYILCIFRPIPFTIYLQFRFRPAPALLRRTGHGRENGAKSVPALPDGPDDSTSLRGIPPCALFKPQNGHACPFFWARRPARTSAPPDGADNLPSVPVYAFRTRSGRTASVGGLRPGDPVRGPGTLLLVWNALLQARLSLHRTLAVLTGSLALLLACVNRFWMETGTEVTAADCLPAARTPARRASRRAGRALFLDSCPKNEGCLKSQVRLDK